MVRLSRSEPLDPQIAKIMLFFMTAAGPLLGLPLAFISYAYKDLAAGPSPTGNAEA